MSVLLRRASEAEARARDEVAHAEWGSRLSVAQFTQREASLRGHRWASEAMQTHLLVQGDEVLASCESFEVCSRLHGVEGRSYSIASVLTEPRLRGRGHATRMLSLLCDELSSRPGAQAVVLYSDVGAPIYERVGFAATAARDITLPPLEGPVGEGCDELFTEGELPPPPPLPGPFALSLSLAEIDWHLERERAYAALLGLPRPRWHGARAGASLLYVVGDLKNGRLMALALLSGERAEAARLLRFGQRLASQAGLSSFSLWVDDAIAHVVDGLATVHPRDGSLPMLRPLTTGLSADDWIFVQRCHWV